MTFAQDHKRIERRHHRIEAELQSRARPYSLVRKDVAKEIRQFVERQAEHGQQLERRLGPIFGGGGSSGGGGGDPSSGGAGSGTKQNGGDGSGGDTGGSGTVGGGKGGGGSSTGGGNDGSNTGTGTGTGSNTGKSGNSGSSGTGTGTGSDEGDLDPASSSTSPRTPKGIFGGLPHHSSTSSSSSSTSSSSIQTTSSSAPTTTPTSSSSTLPVTPSTSYAYVTPTAATPTLNNAAASATPSDTSNNGPGAGLIIGIVAGALAGIAVLVAVIGFLIKKFGKKDDPYESDPFDNDEFRRQSAMLPDQFDDVNPEMSEMGHNNNMNPFNDQMEYAAAGAAGAGAGAAFMARNEKGGPRPPTMFQNHMNAPAAQLSAGDAPPVPVVGAVFNPNHDPSPQVPRMAFGGSDPYSIAGVGRQNFDQNLNNPYGYLDRQYSGSHSPPQGKYDAAPQGYADLDRTGSDGSMHGKNAGQMYTGQEAEDVRSYEYHDTSGRPGTAEGRSGTPDLPNVQQRYAMSDDHESDSRVQSPNRQMVSSPTHLSQDFLSNGNMQQYQQFSQAQQQQQQQYNYDQYNHSNPHSETASPATQPLQVRNLLPNPHAAAQQKAGQRPASGVSSVADEEGAYGGVW